MGPSAQGTRNGPAVSQPRARFPASGRTRRRERRGDTFIANLEGTPIRMGDCGGRLKRQSGLRRTELALKISPLSPI